MDGLKKPRFFQFFFEIWEYPLTHHMLIWGVSNQKLGVVKSPKMDGENFMESPIKNGMIWGENPLFFGNIHMVTYLVVYRVDDGMSGG